MHCCPLLLTRKISSLTKTAPPQRAPPKWPGKPAQPAQSITPPQEAKEATEGEMFTDRNLVQVLLDESRWICEMGKFVYTKTKTGLSLQPTWYSTGAECATRD